MQKLTKCPVFLATLLVTPDWRTFFFGISKVPWDMRESCTVPQRTRSHKINFQMSELDSSLSIYIHLCVAYAKRDIEQSHQLAFVP